MADLMPSGVADYGAETYLQALFGIVSIPSTYYIALLTAEPGAGQDGDILSDTEPTDATYARQSYGTGGSNWATNEGYITNLNDIIFPVPTDDWGYISHYALLDAATSGNLFAWGEFYNPQLVLTDVQMVIPAGGLIVALSSLDDTLVA